MELSFVMTRNSDGPVLVLIMTIRRKANKFSTIRTGNSYAVKKRQLQVSNTILILIL